MRSATHTTAVGTVLAGASSTGGGPSGKPTRTTREDGSAVTYAYDAARRLSLTAQAS